MVPVATAVANCQLPSQYRTLPYRVQGTARQRASTGAVNGFASFGVRRQDLLLRTRMDFLCCLAKLGRVRNLRAGSTLDSQRPSPSATRFPLDSLVGRHQTSDEPEPVSEQDPMYDVRFRHCNGATLTLRIGNTMLCCVCLPAAPLFSIFSAIGRRRTPPLRLACFCFVAASQLPPPPPASASANADDEMKCRFFLLLLFFFFFFFFPSMSAASSSLRTAELAWTDGYGRHRHVGSLPHLAGGSDNDIGRLQPNPCYAWSRQ